MSAYNDVLDGLRKSVASCESRMAGIARDRDEADKQYAYRIAELDKWMDAAQENRRQYLKALERLETAP